MAAQLAIKSIIGEGFIGWETNGMGLVWLFLQSENSMRRLKSDIVAMSASLTSKQREMLDQQLFLHCLIKDLDGYLNLNDPEVIRRITRAIAHFKPNVVVGDPLTGFTTEDLNLDKDMINTARNFARLVKQGDPKRAPLLLQHARTGKAGAASATGFDRGAFGRNSKALHGLTRAQINLAAYKENSSEVVVVASGKCNNAPEFEPFAIELNKETMFYARTNDVDIKEWQQEMAGTKSGKFKQQFHRKQILDLLSNYVALSHSNVKQKAVDELKMSPRTFNDLWKLLKEFNEIKETEPRKWIRCDT